MELGARLREVRRGQKLTLLQVAEQTGLSVSYLSDLERGRTKPSMETLERLSSCFGLSGVDLLAGVDGWSTPSAGGLAPGIAELLVAGRIDEAAARDLNRVELRGLRPRTAEEWHELYLYLRRLMRPYLGDKD